MMPLGGNVSSIVSLSFIEGGHLFSKNSLENSIKDLIDLIKIRLGRASVDNVSSGLLENIFQLRISVLGWLADNHKSLSDYDAALQRIVEKNLSTQPFGELNASLAEVLSAYSQISSPLLEVLPRDFHEIQIDLGEPKPSYGLIRQMSLIPIPEFKVFRSFIDTSLHLEFGFILADLVLAREINLENRRITSELIEFLYSKIIRFGAYAINLDLWHPSEKDYADLFNKMEILAATYELDQRKGKQIGYNDLSALLKA